MDPRGTPALIYAQEQTLPFRGTLFSNFLKVSNSVEEITRNVICFNLKNTLKKRIFELKITVY